MCKIKTLWKKVTMTPMEKELQYAKNTYDVEQIMKRYSYDTKRWI